MLRNLLFAVSSSFYTIFLGGGHPCLRLNLSAPGGREPRRLGGGGCGSGGQDGQVPGPPDRSEGGGGDAADLVAPPKVQRPTENFNTRLCRNFCLY